MESTETQKQRAIDVHSAQAALFDSRYAELSNSAYRNCFVYSRQRLEKFMQRYLPARAEGLRLLDVGCGTGHHLAVLRARGFDVTGVDGSAEMLQHAQAHNPGITFRQADVEALPFDDASFDFVVCIEVLRYLPDSLPCLRELARVLKPGGVCLVTAAPWLSVNGYWLLNQLTSRAQIGTLTKVRQYFASSGRLRAEARTAGFGALTIHGVYGGPFIWVERLIPALVPPLLKAWEPLDDVFTDLPGLREFSNMFLVRAVR